MRAFSAGRKRGGAGGEEGGEAAPAPAVVEGDSFTVIAQVLVAVLAPLALLCGLAYKRHGERMARRAALTPEQMARVAAEEEARRKRGIKRAEKMRRRGIAPEE